MKFAGTLSLDLPTAKVERSGFAAAVTEGQAVVSAGELHGAARADGHHGGDGEAGEVAAVSAAVWEHAV